MYPIINIAKKAVSSYDLLVLIGFAIALFIAFKIGKKSELTIKNIIFAVIFVLVGAFAFGHLFYGVTNVELLSPLFANAIYMTFGEIKDSLVAIFDGRLFYGGFLGGLLALSIYSIGFKKEKSHALFDIYALCLPLAHSIGKIGCFLRGCCYGIECKIGLTVTNTAFVPEAAGVRRLPVSLLEAYFNILIFLLILNLIKKGKFKGKTLWVYALFYSVLRFATEFLRGDNRGRIWLGFSVSQWISVVLCFAAVLYFLITIKTTFREITSQSERLSENKNLIKTAILTFITFGIYYIVLNSEMVKDINITSSGLEKKTMSYCLMFFIVGPLTLGIAWIVWYHRLSAKVSRELMRRNIDYLFTAGDFWLWNILGIMVLVGPFVYLHKLLTAINLINKDYNNKLN